MAQRLSAYLYRSGSTSGRIWHYCPACNECHIYAVEQPFSNGCKWNWNGNVEKPSFTPSMKIEWLGGYGEEGKPKRCHYYVTDGKILYCNDCTHAYAGKTLELPPIPAEWFAGGIE